jgi:hypothetical protein
MGGIRRRLYSDSGLRMEIRGRLMEGCNGGIGCAVDELCQPKKITLLVYSPSLIYSTVFV